MTNKEGFKNLLKISSFPESDFWNKETQLKSEEFKGSVLAFFSYEISAVDKDIWIDELEAKAEAFLKDILALKKDGLVEEEFSILLQFYISCQVISLTCSNKLYSQCYNWICNSISDNISKEPQRNFDFGRLVFLTQSQRPDVQHFFWKCYPEWLADLFIYSRNTGVLYNLSSEVIKQLLPQIIDNSLKAMSDIWTLALCQITAWCDQYRFRKQEDKVNTSLYQIYESASDVNVRKRAGFQLAVGNRTVGEMSRKEWLALVLDEFKDSLKFHEKAQLLILRYQNDEKGLLEHLPEIIAAVKEYVDSMHFPENVASNYYIGSIFKILEPAIYCLLLNGYVAETNDLIATYFQIDPNELVDPKNLYIIPNLPSGVAFCLNKNVLHQDVDVRRFKDVLRANNKFLSIQMALKDDLEFQGEMPKNYGKPVIEDGPSLEKQLTSYFNFSKLKEMGGIDGCIGFSLLFEIQLPIQNLISFQLGRTIPLLRNLSKAKDPRTIKKVFIWQGETYYTEIERIGLQEILEKHGIEVIFKIAASSSKEEFLTEFKSSEYDAFWILSHGEFDHYYAHNSILNLGNEILVNIDELFKNNYTSEKRRLLVMDLCDATTTKMNNPVSIGLGATLTNSSQSLIGYNWPVENLQGVLLGLLLCSFLSEGLSYEGAHFKTISIFCSGHEEVAKRLNQVIENDDVLERIRNVNFDFSNFYYWGILNYIQ
jgi:hypothetical protein